MGGMQVDWWGIRWGSVGVDGVFSGIALSMIVAASALLVGLYDTVAPKTVPMFCHFGMIDLE